MTRAWPAGRASNAYQRQAPPDLFLNFIPLTLSDTSFEGSTVPYESPEQLRGLRAEHQATHVAQRISGDEIALVPLDAASSVVGIAATFEVANSANLVRRLVDESIIRTIVGWRYPLWRFNPASFVMRQDRRDLLAAATGEQQIPWLHVFPQYTLAGRVIRSRPSARFGLLLGIQTRWEIDDPVAALLDRGLDVLGRYVLSAHERADERRDPLAERQLEGRVDSVRDGILTLGDARDATSIPADQAWLEGRRANVLACIDLSGRPTPQEVIQRLDQGVASLVSAEGKYNRIQEIAPWLQRQSLSLASGLTAQVMNIEPVARGMAAGTHHRLSSATFVFDPSATKTQRSPDKGLEEFGPFDAEVFTPKRPHIAVVTPRAFQGDVEVFLRKFKDGVPNAPTFAQGFVRKYRLSDCTFTIESFEPGTHSATAYRDACLRALEPTQRPNLAIVIISIEDKKLKGDQDPYLVAKSTFMSQGVPVQEIAIETVRSSPQQEKGLPYTLSGIAMASYAKLGGVPFVITASRGLSQELVIGLGRAQLSESRFGTGDRVVGITTVFSADGNYLLHNTSREVPYDDYAGALLSTLTASIENIRARNAWQPGDRVRLIFHVFKPFRDVEAQAVKELVTALAADYTVEFAFLHVSDDHDWLLFDRNSEGARDWQSPDPALRGRVKGKYVPERGYAIPLGHRETLLTVIGPRGLITPQQGAPRPLLLTLHRESTFVDTEYLSGQLYRFTSLSWRSLFPTSKPVTILYSELIASLLGRLRHVPYWNPDILRTTLRSSRWFL
jgi:hypothetical protein